ncbi:MAG: alpha/beta hydrolase [Acidobacteriota bacterium]
MRWPRLLVPVLANECSLARILNALAPRRGVAIAQDLDFGAAPRLKLDIYAPAARRGTQCPTVVFFYGGGWNSGDRSLYRFVGANLAAEGIVTVIPDYRVYPEVCFPAFMDDAAQAVAWTRTNAAAFGGDPRQLFLMGHSAGGQIAALLALDGSYLRSVGIEPGAIAGMIGLAGPYDFLPLRDPTLKAIFGPESDWPRSQPIHFVTREAPPMLLLAGDGDETVDPGNSRRLAARLRAAGDVVRLTVYPRIGHKALIGALANPLTIFAPVRKDVLSFIAGNPSGNE